MRTLLILASLAVTALPLSAEEQLHWYQVRTKEVIRGDNYRYYAASPLTLEELAKKLQAKEPLLLKQLVAWSGGNAIPWSEYDRNVTGEILIAADNICSILPLKGDPKESAKADKQDKATGVIPPVEDKPKF